MFGEVLEPVVGSLAQELCPDKGGSLWQGRRPCRKVGALSASSSAHLSVLRLVGGDAGLRKARQVLQGMAAGSAPLRAEVHQEASP